MKDEFTSLKTIFDNSPIGMALSQVSGEIVNMNNCLIKMLGYLSLDDVIDHIKDLSEDLYAIPGVRKEILKAVQSRDVDAPFLVQFKRKDGSIIDVRLYLKKFTYQGNHVDYLISTIEDLTYQKGLEKSFDSIKKQYQQLFNSSPVAIFIHENEKYIEFNNTAKKLFGLKDPSKTYLFTDISPEYQPDGQKSIDKGLAFINKALEGIPQIFNWELKGANGEKIYGEFALNKIESGYSGNVLAIFRDRTEETIAQEQNIVKLCLVQ